MHTQAATAMTTMLATTTTATNSRLLPLLTLAFGLYLVWEGVVLWIKAGDTNTFAPDGPRRTHMIIGLVAMVIGLLIATAGITAL